MSNQTISIPNIDVGTPSRGFLSQDSQQWEMINVRFHGFGNHPAAPSDDFLASPQFICFGHQWRLLLYPGGHRDSDEGNIAIRLHHLSGESISVWYCFSVKDKNGKGVAESVTSSERLFSPNGILNDGRRQYIWGTKDFAKRAHIISALVQGALIIEVRMRQPDTAASPSMPFIPENPLSKIILKKFNNEDSADVVFMVSNEKMATADNNRVNTSTATFYAHRLILEDCAPALVAPCKSKEEMTTIPIPGIEPEIFHLLLYYSYGGKVAKDVLKANARDVINAADTYGVVGLKLEAEAALLASTAITIDNVIELLLYADQKNCALLKEAAVDFFLDNLKESQKLSFENVPSHIMKDLMAAMAREKTESDAGSDAIDLSIARVSTLRKKLHDKGLDVDGSREAMIALLGENS